MTNASTSAFNYDNEIEGIEGLLEVLRRYGVVARETGHGFDTNVVVESIPSEECREILHSNGYAIVKTGGLLWCLSAMDRVLLF